MKGPVLSIGDGNRFLAEELRCLKELPYILRSQHSKLKLLRSTIDTASQWQ